MRQADIVGIGPIRNREFNREAQHRSRSRTKMQDGVGGARLPNVLLKGSRLDESNHVKKRDQIRFARAIVPDQDIQRLEFDPLIAYRFESLDF